MKTRLLLLSMSFLLLFSCKKDTLENKISIEENKDLSYFVDKSQAQNAAIKFVNSLNENNKKAPTVAPSAQAMGSVNLNRDKTVKSTSNIKSTDNVSSIYVVNFNEGGFCLLSNKTNAEPILAFSEEGSFDFKDNTNAGLKIWLEQTLEDIENSDNLSSSQLSQNKTSWAQLIDNTVASSYQGSDYQQRSTAFNQRMYQLLTASGYNSTVIPLSAAADYLPTDRLNHFKSIAQQKGSPEQFTIVEILDKTINTQVGPLIGTNWHQNPPFGSLVLNQLAGCTAVAAGQIMFYYKYPTTYNWNNMVNTDIPTQNDVSYLMQDLGRSFNMLYEIGGQSGAYNRHVKSGLESYGYSVIKKDHSIADVDHFLSTNRPVYMSGNRTGILDGLISYDGHAWVCEGRKLYEPNKAFRIEWQTNSYDYETNGIEYFQPGNRTAYYYMNWGWGADNNGWFFSTSHEQQSGRDYKYARENLYITKN